MRNRNILLVEDDDLVAMTVEDMLLYSGASTVHVAASVAKALQALESQPFDVAILDVNLNGETSWPVAEALKGLGIPYLVVSGYGDSVDNALATHLLPKPYSMDQLLRAVSELDHGGSAAGPDSRDAQRGRDDTTAD